MGSGGTRGNQRDEARAKNLKNAPKQTQNDKCVGGRGKAAIMQNRAALPSPPRRLAVAAARWAVALQMGLRCPLAGAGRRLGAPSRLGTPCNGALATHTPQSARAKDGAYIACTPGGLQLRILLFCSDAVQGRPDRGAA